MALPWRETCAPRPRRSTRATRAPRRSAWRPARARRPRVRQCVGARAGDDPTLMTAYPPRSMRVHALQTGTVQVKTASARASAAVSCARSTRCGIPSGPSRCPSTPGPSSTRRGCSWSTRARPPARPSRLLPRWHPYFRLAVGSRDARGGVGRRARAGIEPADVRCVVLTHMHTTMPGGWRTSRTARCSCPAPNTRPPRLQGSCGATSPPVAGGVRAALLELPSSRSGVWAEHVADRRRVTCASWPLRHNQRPCLGVLAEETGSCSWRGHLLHGGPDARRSIDGVAPDPAQARDTLDRIRRFTEDSASCTCPRTTRRPRTPAWATPAGPTAP